MARGWLGLWGIAVACAPAEVGHDRVAIEAQAVEGLARVPVAGGATAARLALTGAASVRVERLVGPDGPVLDAQDWLGPELLTLAVFDGPGDVVLNWPIRADDPELVPGAWWVELGMTGADGAPADGPLWGWLERKQDPDLRRGRLRAALLIPRELPAGLRIQLDGAVDRWERLLGRARLGLDLEQVEADLDLLAPDPRGGDPRLAEAAALVPEAEVVIWLAEDLLPGVLGLTGAVPSAPRGTLRAASVVALGRVAGPDGQLDADEADALGHLLAHETGHALGLLHPAEPDGHHRDALGDTPDCGDRAACEAALAEQVMFPYAVCDPECRPGRRWSRGQIDVMQRNVGVR